MWRGEDGTENRVRIVMRSGPGGPGGAAMDRHFKAMRSADKAEREGAIAAMRAEMEAGKARGNVVMMRVSPPMPPRFMSAQDCRPGSAASADTTAGMGTVIICQSHVSASARAGLEEARAEIAGDTSIPEETRKKMLQTLDAQIARWSDKGK